MALNRKTIFHLADEFRRRFYLRPLDLSSDEAYEVTWGIQRNEVGLKSRTKWNEIRESWL